MRCSLLLQNKLGCMLTMYIHCLYASCARPVTSAHLAMLNKQQLLLQASQTLWLRLWKAGTMARMATPALEPSDTVPRALGLVHSTR